MRAVFLILLLETGNDGCHDLSKHVAYSQNQRAITTCRHQGGVAVEDEVHDGIHSFPVLVRCEFELADALKNCELSGGVPITNDDGKTLKSCTHRPTPEKP